MRDRSLQAWRVPAQLWKAQAYDAAVEAEFPRAAQPHSRVVAARESRSCHIRDEQILLKTFGSRNESALGVHDHAAAVKDQFVLPAHKVVVEDGAIRCRAKVETICLRSACLLTKYGEAEMLSTISAELFVAHKHVSESLIHMSSQIVTEMRVPSISRIRQPVPG